jgi:hypothetical protein
MSRYARRVDANQQEIIEKLLQVPGITVERNHNDILIGYLCLLTFWYEIKSERAINKAGQVRETEIKRSQKRIRSEFSGHYRIVSSYNEIIDDMERVLAYLSEMDLKRFSGNLQRLKET